MVRMICRTHLNFWKWNEQDMGHLGDKLMGYRMLKESPTPPPPPPPTRWGLKSWQESTLRILESFVTNKSMSLLLFYNVAYSVCRDDVFINVFTWIWIQAQIIDVSGWFYGSERFSLSNKNKGRVVKYLFVFSPMEPKETALHVSNLNRSKGFNRFVNRKKSS